MTRRHIHYEAAFEDYLRTRRITYVAIDEAKRAAFTGATLKSFDFLVYPRPGANFIVDVKGRKVPPAGSASGRRCENWVTREDLDALMSWQEIFGRSFSAVFVFAYWLPNHDRNGPLQPHHLFRQDHYAFLAVDAIDYRTHARRRSAKWTTLSMPNAVFREIAQPLPNTW